MKMYYVAEAQSPGHRPWGWLGTALWEPKCSRYGNQKTHSGNCWHLFVKRREAALRKSIKIKLGFERRLQ